MALRLSVNLLNSVLLPTFGRPTMATILLNHHFFKAAKIEKQAE
jgi:hypothetical protein